MVGAKAFAVIVAPRMMGRGEGSAGMILMKLTSPGSRVKKGDVIAEFDRQWQLRRIDDEQAQVVQAEADISKRKAEIAILRQAAVQSLKQAQAEMEKARLDVKTIEVRSAIDAEKLKLAVEETTARHKQLAAEVPLREASFAAEVKALEYKRDRAVIDKQRAERNADKMLIKAPMDGVVVMMTTFRGNQPGTVQEGDQVYPGSQFMQVIEPREMIVNGTVNQAESQHFHLGQQAEIRLDAYPNESWPGRLISLGALATGSAGMRGPGGGARALFVRNIPVRFRIDAADPRIIPDLSASGSVLLERQPNAVLAPQEAFQVRDGKIWAQVRRSPGAWESREVKLGGTNGTQALVLAGLREGEEVVLGNGTGQ
ncbi:MAG TPA: HlyD family efflux transporter periplasmic adaptor subunit, partial [Anaerolineales bacterium]|nr:HlyD family efflux transporter periplasmic adaptor subunit [Anaerolineales bacterium]